MRGLKMSTVLFVATSISFFIVGLRHNLFTGFAWCASAFSLAMALRNEGL